MPPSTVAMNATRTGYRPNWGETVPDCATSRSRPRRRGSPDRERRRSRRSPARRAAGPCGSPRRPRASGRRATCGPGTGRGRQAARWTPMTDVQLRDREPPTETRLGDDGGQVGGARQRAEDHDRQVLQQELSAKEVTRSVVGSAPRTGRNAIRSMSARDDHDASVATSISGTGARRGDDRVAADHDQLAVGEVDQAHDPEDQGDAEREQGVEAAEAERVDDVLDDAALHALDPEVRRRRSRPSSS